MFCFVITFLQSRFWPNDNYLVPIYANGYSENKVILDLARLLCTSAARAE
jgi:hypothetical protein